MEEMEFRTLPNCVVRADFSKRKIFGLANVFGNQDAYGTVFDKGAFRKTIKNKFDSGKIKFLFNHEYWSVLGKLTRLREGKEGLEFEGSVSDTPLGNDVLTLVQDEALTDNSIGFRRVKTVVDDDDVLHFTEVELFDVSPVTFGANDLALIQGVRRREQPLDVEALSSKIVEEVVEKFTIMIPDLAEAIKRAQETDDSETEEGEEAEGLRTEEVTNQSTLEEETTSTDNKGNESEIASVSRPHLSRARLAIAERELQKVE